MSQQIPIIRYQDNLLVSIQLELTDQLVSELKDAVAKAISSQDIRGLVIELSGVDILDSYIARSIRDISHMARLMGVNTIIAGLDPSMALTLIEMGLVLTGVSTALNLDSALDILRRSSEQEKRFKAALLEGFLDGRT